MSELLNYKFRLSRFLVRFAENRPIYYALGYAKPLLASPYAGRRSYRIIYLYWNFI